MQKKSTAFLLSLFSLLNFSLMPACGSKGSSSAPSVPGPAGGGPAFGGSGAAPKVFTKYSGDTYATVAVHVAGTTAGETVKLFSAANCTGEVASANAAGATHDFNLTGVTAGAHTYYARTASSLCSAAPATYNRTAACPAGFSKVEGNPALGVKPFCVMTFEAKNVGGFPVSQPAGAPWDSLSAVDGKAKCQSLNSGGALSYDLISSLEWSAIVLDAQSQTANWQNGVIGADTMNYGNSNFKVIPTEVTDVTNHWDSVLNANNTPATAFKFRRTHFLSNGSVLWDMSGNADEMVDYTTESTYTSPGACNGGGTNTAAGTVIYCPNIPIEVYSGVDPSYPDSLLVGAVTSTNQSGRTLTRGGGYDSGGIAAWKMNSNAANSATSYQGFRCVYRMNATPKISAVYANDFNPTPSFKFTDVQPGETISLFTGVRCATPRGSAQALSTNPTVTATTPISVGLYNWGYKITNREGVTSGCQVPIVASNYRACPADFVEVRANEARGVKPFCVSKYEVRQGSGNFPTMDIANDYVWMNLNPETAKTKCLNWNAGYNMISNQEWMTIADAAYNVASNWTGGAVGSGFLASGIANGATATGMADDPADPFSNVLVGGNPTTDVKYRRTLTVSTGQVVWDFGGNYPEIVDLGTSTTPSDYAGIPGCTSGNGTVGIELASAAATCPGIAVNEYLPFNLSKSSSSGMGKLFPHASAGGLLRGGAANGSGDGMYALAGYGDLGSAPGGFRCVRRF